jgi:adenylate cyclase
MGREIERKFLVCSDAWKSEVTSEQSLRQGYLAIDGGNNVRVRTDGERAWLTIKARGEGITRPEFEYEIPAADAAPLLGLCHDRVVEKKRHLVLVGDLTWEIDEFSGDNSGLVVAEIELPDEAAAFARPAWLGAEVTGDPRYLNSSLAVHPYARWPR